MSAWLCRNGEGFLVMSWLMSFPGALPVALQGNHGILYLLQRVQDC